ncbi:MAG: DUF5995 family protein [Vicinamibacterales bacterium]
MPATTIDGVIAQLQDVIDECIATGSRLGYFAALYKRMTEAVRAGLAGGAFEDGARIERLDVAFATRYLDTRSRVASGESPGVCWLQAYDAAGSAKHIVLQHLLIGINPHIMIDLGVAAARTCPGPALASLEKDFGTINSIIYSLMPVVDTELDALSPVTKVIDRVVEPLKDRAIYDALEKGRATAWAFAQSLAFLDPPAQASRIGARDLEMRLVGDLILANGPVVDVIRRRESQDVAANIRDLAAPAAG